MSAKKRILRTGCITLVLLAFVGYFAFATFFFAPHEGKLKNDIAMLVPSDVDVFVARANLVETFDSFPNFSVAPKLEGNNAAEAFFASETWRELDEKNKIQETLDKIEVELAKLPMGLEILDIVAGEDVAVAANFDGTKAADTQWAVYARASFVGKLGVSALKYPGLIGLDKQGMTAEQDGDVTTLTGQGLKAPLHVTRVRDVIVAGSSRALIDEAIKLENSGKDSLLASAGYGEYIRAAKGRPKDGSDFEIKFDVRSMRETWGMNDPWPDPKSDRLAPAIIARLLPVSSVRQVMGVLDFDQGLHLEVNGKLSSELMTPEQSQIFRARTFDHGELLEVAGLAPADTTMFVYMRGPIGTITRTVLSSIEPAARDNLDAMVRRAKFPNVDDIVNRLDDALIDRVAFFIRPNDYGDERDMKANAQGQIVFQGPPRDEQPVFAWMVIGWMSNSSEIDSIRTQFGDNGNRIGLEGQEPGSKGFFSNFIEGDLKLYEFWSQMIPGTGHLATMNYGDYVLISNQYQFVEEVTRLAVKRGKSLASDYQFTSRLEEGIKSANVALYLSPSTGTELMKMQAKAAAQGKLENSVDFMRERPGAELRVLQQHFAGKKKGELTADEDLRLRDLVDVEMIALRDRTVAENLPRELKAIDRLTTYLNGIASSLTLVKFGEKEFELSSDTLTPYAD